jgi:L-alanine-DL-glutamate epimerase-like enolase superfamily enzyme
MTGHRLPVERVEVLALRAPIDATVVGNPLLAPDGMREAVMIRVAAGGIHGCAFAGVSGQPAAVVAAFARDHVAPLLRGADAFDPRGARRRLQQATRRAFWTREIALRAVAVAEAALWDLLGAAPGQPLHRIWSPGREPEPLPLFCMAPVWPQDGTVAESVATAERLAALGVAGIKLKVRLGSRLGWREDARRVAAISDALGATTRLVADANQAWSLDEAERFAASVAPHDLAWIEEPCQGEDDRRLLAALRQRCAIALAAGQREWTGQGCEALLGAAAIDICNFDAAIGGPVAWLDVAASAARTGVRMIQHLEPQFGLSLGAAVPNALGVETLPPEADPFFHRMVADAPRPIGGRMPLPTGPGWGMTYDEALVQRFAAT